MTASHSNIELYRNVRFKDSIILFFIALIYTLFAMMFSVHIKDNAPLWLATENYKSFFSILALICAFWGMAVYSLLGIFTNVKESKNVYLRFSPSGFWFFSARQEIRWADIEKVSVQEMAGFKNPIITLTLKEQARPPKFRKIMRKRFYQSKTHQLTIVINGGLVEPIPGPLQSIFDQYLAQYR